MAQDKLIHATPSFYKIQILFWHLNDEKSLVQLIKKKCEYKNYKAFEEFHKS